MPAAQSASGSRNYVIVETDTAGTLYFSRQAINGLQWEPDIAPATTGTLTVYSDTIGATPLAGTEATVATVIIEQADRLKLSPTRPPQ